VLIDSLISKPLGASLKEGGRRKPAFVGATAIPAHPRLANQPKTEGLSRFENDAHVHDSIFSEESPIFWMAGKSFCFSEERIADPKAQAEGASSGTGSDLREYVRPRLKTGLPGRQFQNASLEPE